MACPAAAAAAVAAPPAAAATPLIPCAAAFTRFAAVPESSSRTVCVNQSLTPPHGVRRDAPLVPRHPLRPARLVLLLEEDS